MNVKTGRLSGLKYKLVCSFKFAGDIVREFVYEVDGQAFLKRELMGFGEDLYW